MRARGRIRGRVRGRARVRARARARASSPRAVSDETVAFSTMLPCASSDLGLGAGEAPESVLGFGSVFGLG